MKLKVLETVAHAHASYVETIHRFRDPEFNQAYQDMLRKDGNLTRGPFLEIVPTYQQGSKASDAFQQFVGQPVDNATMSAFSPHERVYLHQEESLRRTASGRNVLVTSGTGSGKTEAFLFPMLAHLYKEALTGRARSPGVRALVLYPLNALSNDQLDRLSDIARALKKNGSKFRFTYGQYTGETPKTEQEADQHERAHKLPRREGELRSREEILRNPPDILLTNYSMLEYLLIRPGDRPLFDAGAGGNWRFIVLDEAHQYNGTKGAEIAFLMRRLKQRIREGGRQEPFTCIATSATILSGIDDAPRAAEFAAALFGEPFGAEDIILGQPTPIVDLATGGFLHSPQALPNHALFPDFLREAISRPTEVGQLASRLGVPRATIEEWANLVATMKDTRTGRYAMTVRFHQFLRTLPGLYVAYAPRKSVALTPRGDAAMWFPASLCTYCGQHYIEGDQTPDGRLIEPIPRLYRDSEAGNRMHFLEITEAEDGEAYWQLNPLTGELVDRKEWVDEKHKAWPNAVLLEFCEPGKRSETGELTECVTCGHASNQPIRSPRLEVQEPQALTLLRTNLALREEAAHEPKTAGPKTSILAFADNRQDAARFAIEAQNFADDALHRSAVLRILEAAASQGQTRFDLDELAERLAVELRRIGSVQYAGVQASKRAYRFLLEEALNPTDNASLLGAGILAARMRIPDSINVPSFAAAGLPENIGHELLRRLADTALADVAVYFKNLPVLISHEELNLGGRRPKFLNIGSADGAQSVAAWDGVRGRSRRASCVRKALASIDLHLEPEPVADLLRDAYEVIRGVEFDGQALVESSNRGDQFDARFIEFQFLGGAHLECQLCLTTAPPGELTTCPVNLCRGTLESKPLFDKGRNPFLELYGQRLTHRFEIQEHTAQLTPEKGHHYQELFRTGAIQALSSSTTFELGVDLGDLDTVFLRNVPPESFNYVQRVGRVGRRSGRPGIVIIFARQKNHDFYHYDNPQRMMRGQVRPPRIALDNERIYSRHAVANVLGALFAKYPALVEAQGTLMEAQPNGIIERIADELQRNAELYQSKLEQVFVDVPAARAAVAEGRWRQWLIGKDSGLARAEREYMSELADLKALETKERERSNYDAAKWCQGRIETIRTENALVALGKKAVIPKYGFPVDVVQLDTQPTHRGGREDAVDLQRDLGQAIREYAPGSEVIANKRVWTSVAVKRPPHVKLDKRAFAACQRHGVFLEAADRELLAGGCGCPRMVAGDYLVPDRGFLTRPDSSRPTTGLTRWKTTSKPFFVQSSTDATKLKFSTGTVDLSAEQGYIVIVASSGANLPFRLCQTCGVELPKKTGPKNQEGHAPPQSRTEASKTCHGPAEDVHLAHRFQTSIMRAAFPRLDLPSDASEQAAFFEGLGTALREAVAELLQVPRQEIGYAVTSDAQEGQRFELVLYDRAPGGAGLVQQLVDPKVLYETLKGAHERTAGSCNCGRDSSCPSCLRTYENEAFHPFLKRGPTHDALGRLMAGFNVIEA